jgi:hypothetical protein
VAAIPVISIDSTTVSVSEAVAGLSYLKAQGYNTISAATYVSWAEGLLPALPTDPLLLTVTGDNESFLAGISPDLVSDGFSAVDFVSTQHADAGGASATWAQLAALTPAAWQFSFSAGAAGATLVASDPITCNIYYACEATGETATTYETRVANEVGAGRLELDNGLWMQTVNDYLWSVPFGDVGQAGQVSSGPSGWLPLWASYVFPVVFVTSGASGDNEHDVLAVSGSSTLTGLETALTQDLSNGSFNGG